MDMSWVLVDAGVGVSVRVLRYAMYAILYYSMLF